MKFRKKPIIIEAIRFDGDNYREIGQWMEADLGFVHPDGLFIKTYEGDMFAWPGDWIIKGVKGEFYPCKPDIFEETYEAVT